MTAVVGFTDGEKVWMGADSEAIAGLTRVTRRNPKVFVNGKFLIGVAGSARAIDLMQYAFTPPMPKEGQDLMQYMTVDFVNAVRNCLSSGGYGEAQNGIESMGSIVLVGHKGRLFRIESDYQVGEYALPYTAIGSGEDAALGALFATDGLRPRERIEIALKAAEQFNAGVRGPFTILEL